jgi:hypothetical protein
MHHSAKILVPASSYVLRSAWSVSAVEVAVLITVPRARTEAVVPLERTRDVVGDDVHAEYMPTAGGQILRRNELIRRNTPAAPARRLEADQYRFRRHSVCLLLPQRTDSTYLARALSRIQAARRNSLVNLEMRLKHHFPHQIAPQTADTARRSTRPKAPNRSRNPGPEKMGILGRKWRGIPQKVPIIMVRRYGSNGRRRGSRAGRWGRRDHPTSGLNQQGCV